MAILRRACSRGIGSCTCPSPRYADTRCAGRTGLLPRRYSCCCCPRWIHPRLAPIAVHFALPDRNAHLHLLDCVAQRIESASAPLVSGGDHYACLANCQYADTMFGNERRAFVLALRFSENGAHLALRHLFVRRVFDLAHLTSFVDRTDRSNKYGGGPVPGAGNFLNHTADVDRTGYDSSSHSAAGDRRNECHLIARFQHGVGLGKNLIYGDTGVCRKGRGSRQSSDGSEHVADAGSRVERELSAGEAQAVSV